MLKKTAPRGATTKVRPRQKSSGKKRSTQAGSKTKRPSTKQEQRAKEKQRKLREKEKAKQLKVKQKRARKNKKKNSGYNHSEYEGQMGNKMSDPRLDRLASTPDMWEKMAENDLYDMLRDMGNGEAAIQKYQKNRVFQALFIGIILIAVGYFMKQNLIMGIGVLAMFIIYKMRYSSVKGMYGQWRFEREMAFSRFIRLLIPYMKQSEGDISLYTVFNKMLDRMDDEADRNSLYMLMGEMSARPGDMRPFIDFAERSSGSDMSHLIMSTVYDFQQSTQDTSVINELGQMASDHMMSAIDEIIAMKIKRFSMFPTKIVMTSFVLVVGFAGGVLLHNITGLMESTGGAGGLF